MRAWSLLAALVVAFLQPPGALASGRLEQLLELAEWTESRRQSLAEAVQQNDSPPADLLALMHRLARFDDALKESAAEPTGNAARVEGRVTTCRPIALTEQDAERLGAEVFYECQFVGNDAAAPTRLFAASVPQAWLDTTNLDEPAEALAFKLGPGVLVAPRVRWLPAGPRGEEVRFGEFVLGTNRFDVGLFDTVVDVAPLLARESEVFYKLLATMRDLGSFQLARSARGNLDRYAELWDARLQRNPADNLARVVKAQLGSGEYSVAPLFNDAATQQGELFVFDGVVRRCLRIESPEAADDYGVDHYFELELFTGDSQNLPLVFCVLELPEGYPTGEGLAQPTMLAGFFLKRWAYRTRKALAGDRPGDKPQLAPLLVGRAPIALSAPASSGPTLELIAAGLFLLALGGVCLAVWRQTRSDAAFEQDLRARFADTAPQPDFDRLTELDSHPPP